MSNLSDRIALVLQSEPASAAVEAIISEAKQDLWRVNQSILTARETTLDPLAASPAVTKARKDLDDLTLQQGRLVAALDRLQDSLTAARSREAEGARAAAYEAAKTETDALAAEIGPEYERLTGKLVALLSHIQANEETVARVNRALPQGKPWLLSAEHRVRGASQGFGLGQSVRLPSMTGVSSMLWPLPMPNLAFSAGREATERMAAQKRAQREQQERVANEAA
jgi:hypothetical protein